MGKGTGLLRTCERCGHRRWRLSLSRCMVCGAVLCENCQMVAGYAQSDGRVAAIVESGPPVLDHPGISHGVLLGMLRPLGMDVHLPRTCAGHVRSALRPGRGSTAPGDRG